MGSIIDIDECCTRNNNDIVSSKINRNITNRPLHNTSPIYGEGQLHYSSSSHSLNTPFDDTSSCNSISIKQCQSLKRIKVVLSFYNKIQQNNNDRYFIEQQIFKYIKNNKYNNLINDFHHILLKHLNDPDENKNWQNYHDLNESLKSVIKCNISLCGGYIRNNRNRQNDNIDINKYDEKGFFYLELLDNIHVHFVHGYDSGMRIKKNFNIKSKNDDDKNEKKNINFHDEEMIHLTKCLDSTRKQLTNVRGRVRIEHSKFVTTINSHKR